MSERPVVSVVIVNFNGADIVLRCVRSVLASTVPVEIVLIDNASTDNSLIALRRHFGQDPRLKILANRKNLGFARANNMAVAHARCEYICFLNPDCVLSPDTLERMVHVMERRPKAGMSGALILNSDGTEQKGCRRRVPTPWRTFVRVVGLSRLLPDHPWFSDFDMCLQPLPRGPTPVDAISGSFMFVRRGAMERVGLMDEEYFLHCEDLDWCMRFREAGYEVLFVPDVSVIHYKGVCGRRRRIRVMWHMHKGMVRFYRKFFRSRYSVFLMWIVLAAVWTRFAVIVAFVVLQRLLMPWRSGAQSAAGVPLRVPAHSGPDRPAASSRADAPAVVVVGARSQVGHFLLPKLAGQGWRVRAVSRRPGPVAPGGVQWVQTRLDRDMPRALFDDARTLIHLAPIWLLPRYIDQAAACGITRLIVFSSTSRYTKRESRAPKERRVAAALAEAEGRVIEACRRHDIAWTIFRPTMIYGCGMDRTVTVIARVIHWLGFFPIPGGGGGLRQPVHAEDLADACMAVLEQPRTYGRDYNLSGGETLSYRDMVISIFRALGRRPAVVQIPVAVLRVLLRFVSAAPGLSHLSGAVADRMEQDLCFDHSAATRDFGYRPRRFLQTSHREQMTSYVPAGRVGGKAASAGRTVLVTGASGFIGSALCRRLIDCGHRPIAVVRTLDSLDSIVQWVQLRIIEDIAPPVGWEEYLEGVDCIVHLAAFVHEVPVGPLSEAKIQYRRLNVEATRHLGEAAARAGVKRIIYISSVKVHGERTDPERGFHEAMEPAPVGLYALSKLHAEQALREIERSGGSEVVIVRPPLVYGPGVKANFLRLIRLVERGVPLPFKHVDNRRSFVYLGNLVDMLVTCVTHPKAAGETFLVSDKEAVSTPELIHTLAYLLGRQVRFVPAPRSLLRAAARLGGGLGPINRLIDSLVVDTGKAAELLQWEPPFTMMEGLEHTVAWYTSRFHPLRGYSFSEADGFAGPYGGPVLGRGSSV